MPNRYVYLNYVQQVFRIAHCRHMRGVFARRTGKTHGQLAPDMYATMKALARGSGAMLGNSNKQLMARTVPAVTMSWGSTYALQEGENYVFGKPPAKLNYPDPIYKPKQWDHTLSFANGFFWRLASLSVVGSLNGVTLSALAADECKFLRKDKLDGEVMPALSGEIHPYGDPAFSLINPYYKHTCFVSDASLTVKGNWLEREEAQMDIPIESGPNKGRTGRELQAEIIEHAHRVIDYNDAVYFAKKAGRKVVVRSQQDIDRATELRELIRQRKGAFHILPKGDITRENLAILVRYNALTERDANLIYDLDVSVTEEAYLYAQMAQRSSQFQEHLQQLRRDCFFWISGSSVDNIALLGKDYIDSMRRSLPPMVYAVSILGMKLKRSSEGFYFALDVENRHGYTDNDDTNHIIDDSYHVHEVSHKYNGKVYKAEVETPDFERIASIEDCRMDGDLHPDDQLCIAMDWNARINWMAIGVERRDPDTNLPTLYVINSMFVKDDEKVEDLITKFNRYYAPHRRRSERNRTIHFYYDATAKQRDYATHVKRVEDFKDTVIRLLTTAGWKVNGIDLGVPMRHDDKYRLINNCLSGRARPAIRINIEKNEYLIFALEHTGVKQGYGKDGRVSIQKDKSGEKLPYNPDLGDSEENQPYYLRSDSTDAFDSLVIGIVHGKIAAGTSVFSGRIG